MILIHRILHLILVIANQSYMDHDTCPMIINGSVSQGQLVLRGQLLYRYVVIQ